jgi:hypothetical protein
MHTQPFTPHKTTAIHYNATNAASTFSDTGRARGWAKMFGIELLREPGYECMHEDNNVYISGSNNIKGS